MLRVAVGSKRKKMFVMDKSKKELQKEYESEVNAKAAWISIAVFIGFIILMFLIFAILGVE
jgi:hypothetical protein